MKKIILGLCLSVLGLFAVAQNGLENVYVERYYVADAIDAANSHPAIPVGSVTYRIYADMLPGYKVQSVYGSPQHTLLMNTTTEFWNNSDYGTTFQPNVSAGNDKKNTMMLDSWLSVGGACNGFNGVPKTEDDGLGTFVNNNIPMLLQNNAPQAGIPLTIQDGMLAGTVPGFVTIGIGSEIGVFADGTTNGNSFTVTNGAWSCLAGASGPIPASNKLLIAQITTNGVFHFELNIQIGTPAGGTEKYVVSNPAAGELTIPSLTQTLYPAPVPPAISITAPANNSTFSIGTPIGITADANDLDGTVTQVQFFVDGISVGIDLTAPYTAIYTGLTEASHLLTAVATDNDGQTTTSAVVHFNVGNAPPTVGITAPSAGSVYIVGDVVAIAANASDPDGTVSSVEFFVDGVSLLVDNTAPYTANYTAVAGTHALTAKATDNNGKFTTSAPVSITVNPNTLPTVAITSPVNGATPPLNTALTLTATASDVDGTITSVEFFSGATSLGLGSFTAPNLYNLTFTPAVQGPITLTAKATDNKGGIQLSAPVTVTITDYSVAYAITFTSQVCNIVSVCMPLRAVTGAQNVNGYNFTVQYDKTKVAPTGNITVSNALLLPYLASGQNAADITDYITSIDATAGKISIAIFFNGNAPVNAVFNGQGDVCCVEFNKTAGMGSLDVAVFSFTEIIESYPSLPAASKSGSSGNFNTFRDETLSGSLKYWYDMSPIQYDPTNPGAFLITNIVGCGLTENEVQPDIAGNFVFNTTNGTSLDIKRDIAPTTNVHTVISGYDAYLTALASVNGCGQINWTPLVYQMIAMDVNRDGKVTAGDATQINQRAVLLIPEFSQIGALGKDWSFVANTEVTGNPAYQISATFPLDDGIGYSKYRVPVVAVCQAVPTDGADCPTIQDEIYIGVLIGDIDGSYAGIAPNGTIKSTAADTTSQIVIDLSKALISNGEMSIPVSLICNDVVHSFDFDLLINDLKASVKSVTSQYNINLSWNYIVPDKMLSVASFSLNPIPTENTASLVLTLLTEDPITSIDLTGTFALINGIAANMIIIDATTGIAGNDKEEMVKVYPNPVSGKLNVEVSVNSMVQLLDLSGKQVVAAENVNANHKQTIDVSNFAAGVYMVKIYNDKFVKIQKILIEK